MSFFWLSFLILTMSILYFLFVKPLIPIISLKLKLGNKALVIFRPIGGFFELWHKSQEKFDDVMAMVNEKLIKNPQTQVILSNLFGTPFLMFTGPEYIKNMYLEHEKYEKGEPFNYESLITKGLIMSEGDSWKWQRKFLGNAFTFEKLKARIPMINEVVKDIMNRDPKDNINTFTSRITGEVVIRSFFGDMAKGLQFEGQEAQISLVDLFNVLIVYPLSSFYVMIKQMIFKSLSWKILPTKQEKELVKRITNFRLFVKQLIEQRINELKNQTSQTGGDEMFLDIYLKEYINQINNKNDNKHKIEMEEIIQQFITLFFAGTDTTATTCGTSFYFLAQFQEYQQELYNEIINIIGEGDITAEHINQLQNINAFLQEVLRFKNPAFMSLVRQVKQNTQVLDIKLKKDWLIAYYHNASSLQNNYFNNPLEFNYKRWFNNNVIKNDNGFIHIPFAAGGRNCIGQHMALIEAKIILAQVIRKYKIILNPKVNKVQFGHRFLYCVQPDNCVVFQERK